ncbi:sugar lactone lactonase YvrE [Paenibacillus rhizosphaerae]|uniref:Sugar lactone lactonase YvrE n=1 Tax=Paenibacillus rhizosphaerae TaxID=297318 RepID=A0A839U0B4_9BACL|nr:YIP1 family protein [Paenibacillus rhizosphaerae]MBB3130327.1 sugar lactone lactonase YvrE [Paenibacillus rhizosphaerae]
MKKWFPLLLVFMAVLTSLPGTAMAKPPYMTSYYDPNQSSWFRIQPIYRPAGAISADFGEPADLDIAADDRVYIADKKKDRIAVLNPDGTLLRTIGDAEGKGQLSGPEGVYVTSDNEVYVADSGNQRIAVFDGSGQFQKEYKKPDTPLLGSEHFVPVKLVVDRRGVMYIQLNSSYQGLVRLNPKGEFMGYFGANKADQSMLNWLKKLVLNKEQLSKEKGALPKPITNVAIDPDGFVYTATAGGEGKGAIRKLNAGGVDAFKNKTLVNGHGIVDVAIDPEGFLYNIDLDSMSINLYDRSGEAMFEFGDIDKETQQYGVLGYPTGIGIDSEHAIWISDSGTNTVHKYVRTAFGSSALQALALYADGKYEESKPYWEAVYARNDMYNGTFQGLGKVFLHEDRNDEALSYMKAAFDTDGYSKAFWQIRMEWLQRHFVALVAGLAAVMLAVYFGYRLIRWFLRKRPLPASWKEPLAYIRNLGYVLIHPYEGFYKIKEARIPAWITISLLLLVIGIKLCRVYFTGFLFHPVDLSEVNLMKELGLFALPWVTWIIANYLVCSIKDGEGRFREVIQGSVYALSPYVFFSVPTILLSNIASLDEVVIIHALNTIMTVWLLAMFIVMTQVIHNFDFLETLKNSAISVFAILTIWMFGFIIFGLSYNLYDFFYELYKEVNIYH